MFDLGKKNVDKGQGPATRESSAAPSSPAELPVSRRPAVVAAEAPPSVAVIGPSTHIDGDLRGEEDLLIEGEVSGTIQLRNNTLTIGPQGKVSAEVYAHSVFVEGYLEGDLYGSERICIRSGAHVRGNITAPRISLEDGARFTGSIEMDPQAVEGAVGKRHGSSAGASAQRPQSPPLKGDSKLEGTAIKA